MNMSDKCKAHVDSCRFCWMCHHICPIGNATGQERNTARARALGISLVNREAIDLSEIMDNIFECATCGACVHDCVTGWDPVMFTKETRLQAALEDKLPAYINALLDNALELGNPYGKTALDSALSAAIADHAEKTDLLFYLGTDARYMVSEQAVKAIKVMEKVGKPFTVLADEPASGAQVDFLIGAAEETKEVMAAAAKAINAFATVVVYDPDDAKAIMQLYKEYGVEVTAKVVTYTAYLAEAVASGALARDPGEKTVAVQDPYQLARDLGETEELRTVIGAFATVEELLLNRAETVWAGNILMAQYLPEIIQKVAARRIFNAKSIHAKALVTASPAEYTALKAVDQADVEILSLEDLILGV
ncbi:MAG: (Fe-S)-binding protein [Clostridia bacterium]|nr:(Fe-S)-binding protein [Clostridia bacterium]MBQ7090999.1 (Fe-S)-binding protein [Clostridia bacterium]